MSMRSNRRPDNTWTRPGADPDYYRLADRDRNSRGALGLLMLHRGNDAPPQTVRTCPVIDFPWVPRRKDVRAPTSSGSTSLPSGGVAGDTVDLLGSTSMGVSVGPGATTLTVIRRGANSMAQLLANPVRAALVAAY